MHGGALASATAMLRDNDAELYRMWRNISRIEEIDWQPGAQRETPEALAFAISSFTSYLIDFESVDDAEAIGRARYYLAQNANFSPSNDDRYILYQGVLERGLHWIDPDKVRARQLTPTEILQAVYHHRRPPLSSRADLMRLLQRRCGVLIDEAALIHFFTRSDTMPSRIDDIQRWYADALIREWTDASLGQHLLPSSPLPLTCSPFWFDGASIQNGQGKNIEQMVSTVFESALCIQEGADGKEGPTLEKIKQAATGHRHLFGQPDSPVTRDNWMELIEAMGGTRLQRAPYDRRQGTIGINGWHVNRDEIYRLFEKAMQALGLDTNYPLCTPHHAMATKIRKFGASHQVTLETPNNPSDLIAAFNRLQDTWRHDPRSPVSPLFMAGIHLVRCKGVFIVNATSDRTPEQQAIDRVWNAGIRHMQEAGIDVQADVAYLDTALSKSGRPSHEIFQEIHSSPLADRLPLYLRLDQDVKTAAAAPIKISFANTIDLSRKIIDYFFQELRSHAEPPGYSKTWVIRQILRRELNMTDRDLRTARRVGIGTPTLSSQAISFTPMEEFERGKRLSSATMSFKGRTILPRREWWRAQDQIFEKLARHPTIVAKSMQLLRRRNSPYSDADVAILSEAQTNAIMSGRPGDRRGMRHLAEPQPDALAIFMETLSSLFGSPTLEHVVDALSSGNPRQILELFPFIIPIFDIEEGIRLSDPERAFRGARSLLVDTVFTLVGAVGERALAANIAKASEELMLARSAMPLRERTGVDSLLQMCELIPEFRYARVKQRFEPVQDLFDVHVDTPSTHTHPKMLQAIYQATAESEQEVYRLEVDGATVIATPDADGFVETNAHGEPILGAPPIFFDASKHTYFRLGKDHGLPKGATGILESELRQRGTVARLEEYWSSIDLEQARVASPEPLDLIRSLFEQNADSQHARFEQLLLNAYERSETARIIMNHAYTQAPFGRQRCQIVYNGEDAFQRGSKISFVSDEDLLKLQYTGPSGWVPFQVLRMILHEVLHFLTKLKDPAIHEVHNNRGPIVALVEKILAETLGERPYPPRLTYAQQGKFKIESHRGVLRTNSKVLRQLTDWSNAEDLHIDRLFDAKRTFPDTLYAMGQPIAERQTVRQGLELVTHLVQNVGTLGAGNAQRIFKLVGDCFQVITRSQKELLKHFIETSRTFRILAAAWEIHTKYPAIEIRSMESYCLPLGRHALGRRMAHINALDGGKVWLNSQPLYYFSSDGTIALSRKRQLAEALLDLFVTSLLDVSTEVFHKGENRGVVTLLGNEVMRQIKETEPETGEETFAQIYRICDGLTDDSHAYLRDQSAITRAAKNEDGYLYRRAASLPPKSEEGEPLACRPEPTRRSSLFGCILDV